MMLAGVPVADSATAELHGSSDAGADEFADRLERAVTDGVSLLALTIDERAIISASSKTHPTGSSSFAPCS